MFLPFSNTAKIWERYGGELRRLARVAAGEKLDPWKLAPKVGLTVIDGGEAVKLTNESTRRQLLIEDRDGWSGGVFPEPLSDGTFLCILNPTHGIRRNKITLMEEIAHRYLKHKPSGLALISDGVKVRDYDKRQEQEAYGVGSAALIPWVAFFPAVNAGRTVTELAEKFDVSPKLIEYRIKTTGGSRIYKARQREKAGMPLSPGV